MKYFTPELFTRSNSDRIEVAVAAGDEWEAARKAYRRRLAQIRARLPAAALRFAKHVFLHDFEILGLGQTRERNPITSRDGRCAILFLRNPSSIYVLNYLMKEEPLIERSVLPKHLEDFPPIWLYDEFDIVNDSLFSHEVLLSTGTILKFHFSDFFYSGFDQSRDRSQRAEVEDLMGQLLLL